MQGFLYCIREAFRGFRQARLSSLLSILTFTISLLLIGCFLFITVNLQKVVETIKAKLEIEVFIDNSYEKEQIAELKKRITSLEGVQTVQFISKDDAVEILEREFGEKIVAILDENPLPSSFRIRLSTKFQQSEKASGVVEKIQKMDGIDDVVYRLDLLRLIDKYLKWLIISLLVGGILVSLSGLFFVYNTIRLIIYSRRDTIEIMKLVGATPGFIRFPFLIEGFIQGFLGTSFALFILYIVQYFLAEQFSFLSILSLHINLFLLIGGIIIGLTGSGLAISKYLKY